MLESALLMGYFLFIGHLVKIFEYEFEKWLHRNSIHEITHFKNALYKF